MFSMLSLKGTYTLRPLPYKGQDSLMRENAAEEYHGHHMTKIKTTNVTFNLLSTCLKMENMYEQKYYSIFKR